MLESFLGTASIKTIDIDFEFLLGDGDAPRQFSLFPHVFSQQFPNLQSLTLDYFVMHLSELEQILSPSNPSLTFVSLDLCHLLSGTWREAFDLLREYLPHRCPINVTGAEINELPAEEYDAIFEVHSISEGSLIDQYFEGRSDRNPLKKPYYWASVPDEIAHLEA